MDVIDLVTHEGLPRRGVQLTAFADWQAIAAWCGGTLVEAGGRGFLMLADGTTADLDDWIVKLGAMSCFIAWPASDAELLYAPPRTEE